MRENWQIEQGGKCPCGGSDEYCPCQNVDRSAHKQPPSHAGNIRDAMQDLLNAPKGVVPESAALFFDTNHGRFSTHLVSKFLEQSQ